jgi:transposase
LDEPVAGGAAASSRRPKKKKVTSQPPEAEAADTPACSKAQVARRLGAEGRLVMRSIGLDLGARHIAYCEVRNGVVVDRASVKKLEQLKSRIGPGTDAARIAFDASREGWYVHDTLVAWGHEAKMIDTTRVRAMGVGHHKRKNDALDAEVAARAVEQGRIPEAHVLSPERRALRAKLSVRGALVETRSQYVTTIRGLGRAAGVLLSTCATENFVKKVADAELEPATRGLIAPLIAVLVAIEKALGQVEYELSEMAQRDPIIALLATAPGVGLIVASTFVSVIDEARRFRNAQAVGAYLGLVPAESTTGGPDKRRLGSITKQGNTHARKMLVQAGWLILRSSDKDDPCSEGGGGSRLRWYLTTRQVGPVPRQRRAWLGTCTGPRRLRVEEAPDEVGYPSRDDGCGRRRTVRRGSRRFGE